MTKIVITGPECSGKSTLTRDLGLHYNVPVLDEYAREYLQRLNKPYVEEDLLAIAQEQALKEIELQKVSPFFCDTSFLVLKVWSQVKFGRVDPFILNQLERYPPDLYLLPHFDIPYEEDSLREHPNERDRLYKIYLDELNQQAVPWVEVKGSREVRVLQACKNINTLIKDKS